MEITEYHPYAPRKSVILGCYEKSAPYPPDHVQLTKKSEQTALCSDFFFFSSTILTFLHFCGIFNLYVAAPCAYNLSNKYIAQY